MAVDKSLYEAPLGLEALAPQEPIEIEIVDPEEVRIGVDGMMIELGKEEPRAEDFDANLAEYMSENELGSLAGELIGNYDDGISGQVPVRDDHGDFPRDGAGQDEDHRQGDPRQA